jgi:hypothetical protein
MLEKLITFLRDDLQLSSEQIQLGMRQIQGLPSELPMVLWQYGFIDISQLDSILDWLDRL